jgi:LPS-assembly protein
MDSAVRAVLLTVLLGMAWLALSTVPGRAQFAALSGHGGTQPVSSQQPVTFIADRVIYDRARGLVTAEGHVQAWQNDHVLLADKIVFDRNTNVVAATGHVSLIEPDGQVLSSEYAELTQGMRDAVLKGMGAILAENGKLVANGARRTGGEINEMSQAIYSTCNLCAKHPEEAPLWELRATTATQDVEQKRIEYRNVWLDIYGVPVAYFPYFWHADPSVKRASGFLVPSFGESKHIGAFASVPYYWVLDGQSDLTITPTLGTQAQALDLRYRRRFNDGVMSIDGSLAHDEGSAQADIFANGQFNLNDTWRYGFDIERASSADYLRDFRVKNISPNVLTSQVYLEGFGDGAYSRLDARAYQALNLSVTQNLLPTVLPRYEYSFFGKPDPLGGRFSLDFSAFNVLRDVGTNTQRMAARMNWERPFTGALGDLWKLILHVDSAAYVANKFDEQPNFAPDSSTETARALPTAGVKLNWPFVRDAGSLGSQLIEPIAQILVSPNVGQTQNLKYPNEDSLGFDFSDANLFAINRFNGLDRLEGGTRAAVAMHGAWYFGGSTLDGLVGQSYRAQKEGDIFPPKSGLNDQVSDVVARVSYSPSSWVDVTSRWRFDHRNFDVAAADAVATVGHPIFRLNAGYIYSNVDPYYLFQAPGPPPASYFVPRDEISLGASTQTGPWKLSAYARRDLTHDKMVLAGVRGTFENECFIFDISAYRRYTDFNGDTGATTVLFSLTFKTVGQVGFNAF